MIANRITVENSLSHRENKSRPSCTSDREVKECSRITQGEIRVINVPMIEKVRRSNSLLPENTIGEKHDVL